MLFTEFKNYAKENIINYLTPDFEGAEMSIRTVHKANGTTMKLYQSAKRAKSAALFQPLTSQELSKSISRVPTLTKSFLNLLISA